MFLYVAASENRLGIYQIVAKDEEEPSCKRTIRKICLPVTVVEESRFPSPSTGFLSRFTPNNTVPTTAFILKHPSLDLLYAFSNFGTSIMLQHKRQSNSLVTTYRIDRTTGLLTHLSVCSTGGLHVSYATTSPDQSTLVVCHEYDGRLSFMDLTVHDGVLREPDASQQLIVVETPEVRPETRSTQPPHLPSLQHCAYTPDGKYLLTVDASSQSRIWTYPVNECGHIMTPYSQKPLQSLKARPIAPAPNLWMTVWNYWQSSPGGRMRRIVFHPSHGRYMYILWQSHAVLQVYEMNPSAATRSGPIIFADCLQEISCLGSSSSTTTPFSAAEWASDMQVTTSGLWVSLVSSKWKEGASSMAGRNAIAIDFYQFQQDGGRLKYQKTVPTGGSVPCFLLLHSGSDEKDDDDVTILTGTKIPQETGSGLLESFRPRGEQDFEELGRACIDMEILCMVTVPQQVVVTVTV